MALSWCHVRLSRSRSPLHSPVESAPACCPFCGRGNLGPKCETCHVTGWKVAELGTEPRPGLGQAKVTPPTTAASPLMELTPLDTHTQRADAYTSHTASREESCFLAVSDRTLVPGGPSTQRQGEGTQGTELRVPATLGPSLTGDPGWGLTYQKQTENTADVTSR